MAFAGRLHSTPRMKAGFLPLVLSRLRGRLQRGAGCEDFFNSLSGMVWCLVQFRLIPEKEVTAYDFSPDNRLK